MPPSDPMGDAIQSALDEMAMERARERGEVSDVEALDPTTLEHGIWTVGEDGAMEYQGTVEDVSDQLNQVFVDLYASNVADELAGEWE